MLMVNDYIQLVKKPYDDFPIDTTMLGKVINIRENTIVVNYPMGNMAMSLDEFTKYFVKHIPENSDNEILNKTTKRKFTDWKVFEPDFDSSEYPYERISTPIYEYCHNGKTVKVRRVHYNKKDRDILTGRSSCSPYDEFDLETGLKLAYARCKQKEVLKEFADKLSYYNPSNWM